MLTILLLAALVQGPSQPSQAELEAAILAHQTMLFTHPRMCPPGTRNCPKGPKRITVTQFACDGHGRDQKGEAFLVCRTSFRFVGGAFAHVRTPVECVPLRWSAAAAAWRVALIPEKDQCGTPDP